jgi:hypothetical protein
MRTKDRIDLKLIPQKSFTEKDFKNHLEKIGNDFIEASDQNVTKLDSSTQIYFNSILENIFTLNQIFFEKKFMKYDFYVVQTNDPFYFSLPANKIFLSSGLIKKYLDHESSLVCILAFELVKNSKFVYQKQVIVPTGFVPLNKALEITRVPLNVKMEVHKWAYYLINRSGYDESSYLIWIQTINRNYLDFGVHLGDRNSIFFEEANLKEFIVNNYGNNYSLALESESSPSFNRFRDHFQ